MVLTLTLTLLFNLGSGLGFGGPGPSDARAATAPWNVILIVTDDLGAHDLGATGSSFHRTPNLDRLTADGLRFTQAYAACTVCSPTRAAIATGKYPARLHLTDWIKGHDRPAAKLRPPAWTQALPLAEVTLAERLKARGYTTAHLGKWHLGGDGFGPEQQGFDHNLGGDHRGQPPSYFSPYGLPKLPDGPPGEYLTDREGEEAVRFIAANRDRPFFLNYWPHAVHTPLQAPSDAVASFRARAGTPSPGRQANPTYAAMLERLDAAVGRLRQALRDHGLAERTLVVFTSDNGGLVQGSPPPTSNHPLRSGKGSPYEGGHRVPLIVHWPGVTPPGSTCATPVASIDLLPTLLDALGVSAPDPAEKIDGVSLVPLLKDPAAGLPRPALFWHYPHYHPGGATPYAAVRAGDWKLIQDYETGRHELFDLRADPAESTNLAGTHPERVVELARLLFQWQGSVDAQWPMPNPAWEPPAQAAQADGSFVLHARDAQVHGQVLRYEPQPFKNTLGWWTQPEDWVRWTVSLPAAGRYTLEILQGCGRGSGGSTVEFAIADQRLVTTVIETGGFQNFTNRFLGTLDLPIGTHSFTVKPIRKPGLAVMDLREVRLSPTPALP